MSLAEIERMARQLARDNRQAEPGITKIYWFPDDEEVRLVEVLPSITPSGETMQPFYFRPSPADGYPAPSGVALITPDEDHRVALPPDWGTWRDARELDASEVGA